jgi:choline dehydrogenase
VQRDHYAKFFWQQAQEQNDVLPPDNNHTYTTGRMLGGESSVGDSRYNRGTAEYYAILAELVDDDIWNATNMLEILREIETYYPADNTSFLLRGHEGLLPVAEQGIVTSMASKLVAAFTALTELPALNDYNDLNATSEVGPFERWQNMIFGDAERMSANKVFLNEDVRERPNLVIRLHSTATRVLFTHHKEAYAVAYLENGKYREAWGKDRIILTAGINSPVILQQSGIGDADYLDAIDVAVVHNNTNVGRVVYNHNGITVRFHKNTTDEPSAYNSDLYEGGAWLPNPISDDDDGDFLSTTRRVQAAAINLGAYMDLEFFSLQPRQSGYVTIRDNDPLRAPQSSDRIFLGEDGVYEENFYIDTIRDYGCALTDIFTGEDSAPIDPEYYMVDPPYAMCGDTSGLRQWVRQHATVQAHDWAGSNRMGTTEDEISVCNSKGSVHGVTKLTIADSSVLPQINNGAGIALKYAVALNIAKEVVAKRH